MTPIGLLISCSWKAAVLVMLTLMLLRVMRRSPAAERRSVWAAVFLALMVLPLVSVLWSRIPLVLQNNGAAERALIATEGVTVIEVAGGGEGAVALGLVTVVLIWVLGAIGMLVWTGFGYLRASFYLRGTELLDAPCSHTQADGYRVLCSPSAVVPMVVGLWKPVIVLPAAARSWNPEQLSRVLAHEAGHLRNGDARWKFLSSIVLSLYWFHPLVWLAASHFDTEREHVCDDAVLNAGNRPSHYAADLIDFAKRAAGCRIPQSVIPMASPSRLETRISAILDGTKHRQPLRRNIVMSYTFILALLLLPLSAVQSFARASAPEDLRAEMQQLLVAMQEPSLRESRTFMGMANLVQRSVEESTQRHANMPIPAAVQQAAAAQPNPDSQPVAAAQESEPPKRIRIGGVVAQAKVVRKVQPVYPQAAKDEGVEGTVRLNILIDPEGHVVETDVVTSPDDRLSQASIDAVSQWLYAPTLLNGNPVEVVTVVDINFTLQ